MQGASSRREDLTTICHACRQDFNHEWVGSTEDAPPLPGGLQRDGWVLDHNRVQVWTPWGA